MATDILSIPQIPNQDASTLQNDMHIGQGADISRRLQNVRWTDSTHQTKVFPDNVDALMADNYSYVELIKSIQETIKYYRQISDDRRRTSRRVSVKSDVVGRHTYATVSGWTWERLIQNSKAALAVSDETDPARIVSTDKKALKAGGLLLALNGVAVKPTDDVDAEKEYVLVAIDGRSSDSEVTPVRPE